MGSPFIYAGRRSKALSADGLILSDNSIIDNDGPINYITNGHAEVDTTGWATYADAAGTSPVNGTAGSATTTWTRSTTTPLRGVGSFLLTKDAANRQGEGVSYDFSIDTTDQGKPLQIDMDWTLVSGTFVGSSTPGTNSDVTVWLYDVTNGTVIQPAGYLLEQPVTTNWYKLRSTFQTAINSTSYRLIFHVTTTSASAYVLKMDNIRCGPQVVPNGAVVTDWTSFTPTGSWSTNTTYTGYWRRVGDSMEIDALVATSGAPTSASLTVNLPSGYTIDTTKLSNSATDGSAQLGVATVLDGGVANYPGSVKYNSTTSVSVRTENAASTYSADSAVTQAVPITFGASDKVHLIFRVPISGWSSNVQMSSDAGDSRVVAARAAGAATAQTAAFATLDLASATVDTHAGLTLASDYWTVPVSGYYDIGAYLVTASGAWTAGDQIFVGYSVDGGSDQAMGVVTMPAVTAVGYVTGLMKNVQLNAGQVVRWRSANSRSISTSTSTYVYISRSSGPAQIASSESVSARYSTNTAQSVANTGFTRIDFEDKVWDSHNAVTVGASWAFTAPISGIYRVNAKLLYGSYAYAAGNSLDLQAVGNAGTTVSLDYFQQDSAVTEFNGGHGSCTFRMLAGQTIYINAGNSRTAGATLLHTDGAHNYIEIDRIANY